MFFPNNTPLSKCYLLKYPTFSYEEKNIKNEKIRYLKFSHTKGKANIIVFHGNAGGACDRGIYAQRLSESEVNIILAEYPGYSGDQSKISEKTLLQNAQLLFDEIKKDGLPLILYGESLGTGVTTYLASKNKVLGLILHNPYTSISEVGQFHYPLLPINLLNKNSFNSKNWAQKVEVSPLIIQGEVDRTIPTSIVEKQLENFKNKPQYTKIKNADHNDLLSFPQVFEKANQYIQTLFQ